MNLRCQHYWTSCKVVSTHDLVFVPDTTKLTADRATSWLPYFQKLDA